jgi:hypothetical protein
VLFCEVDQTKILIHPKGREEGCGLLMAMIRQDNEKGITKDWGACRNNNARFKQISALEGGKYERFRKTILQII